MNRCQLKKLAVIILVSMSVSRGLSSEMPTSNRYTNSVGMEFVRIEPGTFEMGQLKTPLPLEAYPAAQDFLRDGDFDEKPVHTVTITKAFYIGIFEVTNYQYELFDPGHKKLRGKDAGLSRQDDEAVVNVNWYDAQAFCRWLSDKDGLSYRLPTETEWEYACRAGTTTNYHTGDVLPKEFHKKAHRSAPRYVSLRVGDTPANRWGLYDMHGNVEEWCQDWYGPYTSDSQADPAGYISGNFRVTRGGSHGTDVYYLRSANRSGAVPQIRNWLTGFRVVLGEPLDNAGLLTLVLQRYQKGVVPRTKEQISKGPDADKPYFKGPRRFVNIPIDMAGPVFASHNHNTSIVECPNGDLLASWFSTVSEGGREMVQACSRLRWGAEQWEQASQLWDAPDRNDSGHRLWHDGNGTIYHFANPSFAAVSMAVLSVRESQDNGVTWSVPRVALPDFSRGQGPANKVFRMKNGTIAMPTDLKGTMLFSRDETLTWTRTSGGVAGIHAPVIELDDGLLMAFGRGGNIDGMMPMSISRDRGESWTYAASEFPPIGGKQKAVLLRLRQGPLFFASFADLGTDIVDASGTKRKVRGLFAAVSNDRGSTWVNKRLVTDDAEPHPVETTAGGLCVMSSRNAEFRGYMSAVQATNGLIHLLTSREHYAFNVKWLMSPQPAPTAPPVAVKTEVESFNGPDFDLDGWAHYHSYRGEFNNKGQYSIESLSPVSGLNRIVGKDSFDMSFTISDIRFGPCLRENSPAFTLWLKDDRVRTLVVSMRALGLGFSLKDREADKAYEPNPDHKVEFKSPPESAKFRLVYDENSRKIRIYYGINGAEPTTETPQSADGIYFSQPLTESTVVYLLMTNGKMSLDHYQVKPPLR